MEVTGKYKGYILGNGLYYQTPEMNKKEAKCNKVECGRKIPKGNERIFILEGIPVTKNHENGTSVGVTTKSPRYFHKYCKMYFQ